MRHLRLHPSAIKTFCDEAVNAHPRLPLEDQATEDPAKSDCVRCLGQAVLFHETQARIAEDRLTKIAADKELLVNQHTR